ncbi:MAG: C69 family dipeptidase [Eggerthellaceae bacterium]|nr:C69 family dipeptidase [Eggerthellaceae bacterium]
MPNDCYVFCTNSAIINYIDFNDSDNFAHSPDLYNLPANNGLAVMVDDQFGVAETYDDDLHEFNQSCY